MIIGPHVSEIIKIHALKSRSSHAFISFTIRPKGDESIQQRWCDQGNNTLIPC